jgi:hypothetical protein
MSLADLRRALRCHWRAFADFFWPEQLCEQIDTDLALVTEELRQRQQRLLGRRRRIEALRARLARREHRLSALSARVQEIADGEVAAAVEALQRLRQSADTLRARIGQRERAYERQRRVFACWKRQHAGLRGLT